MPRLLRAGAQARSRLRHGARARSARATVAAADYYLREPREALDAAEACRPRALALDPTDPKRSSRSRRSAGAATGTGTAPKRCSAGALSFNPSNEGARRLYGMLLGARRQHDAAVAMTDRALELDPLCLTASTSAAWVRYVAGDYDDVIERCRHTIDMDPALPGASPAARRRPAAGGRRRTAASSISTRCRRARTDPISLAWLAHALGVKGDRDRAVNILCHLDELAQDRYVSSYHRALAHAGLGDLDATFTLLAHACDERDPWLMHLASEPRFDNDPVRRRATPPSSGGSG